MVSTVILKIGELGKFLYCLKNVNTPYCIKASILWKKEESADVDLLIFLKNKCWCYYVWQWHDVRCIFAWAQLLAVRLLNHLVVFNLVSLWCISDVKLQTYNVPMSEIQIHFWNNPYVIHVGWYLKWLFYKEKRYSFTFQFLEIVCKYSTRLLGKREGEKLQMTVLQYKIILIWG